MSIYNNQESGLLEGLQRHHPYAVNSCYNYFNVGNDLFRVVHPHEQPSTPWIPTVHNNYNYLTTYTYNYTRAMRGSYTWKEKITTQNWSLLSMQPQAWSLWTAEAPSCNFGSPGFRFSPAKMPKLDVCSGFPEFKKTLRYEITSEYMWIVSVELQESVRHL